MRDDPSAYFDDKGLSVMGAVFTPGYILDLARTAAVHIAKATLDDTFMAREIAGLMISNRDLGTASNCGWRTKYKHDLRTRSGANLAEVIAKSLVKRFTGVVIDARIEFPNSMALKRAAGAALNSLGAKYSGSTRLAYKCNGKDGGISFIVYYENTFVDIDIRTITQKLTPLLRRDVSIDIPAMKGMAEMLKLACCDCLRPAGRDIPDYHPTHSALGGDDYYRISEPAYSL